jgi:arylsulfatase A-like enzyme
MAAIRWVPLARGPRWRRPAIACAVVAAWVGIGQHAYATDWITHYDRRIAENPPWVFVASWWQAMSGERTVRMADRFDAAFLADFEPIGRPSGAPSPAVLRRLAPRRGRPVVAAPRRPPNVILIVLESVAARWTGVSGGLYDTTPTLRREAARGLVGDSFYAHVGRSSNALASMLLSVYPKLDFRDFTEEYPRVTRTSLAGTFQQGGYRTAFLTPSDLTWAGWEEFVRTRGFDEVHDYHGLPCDTLVSSWGVEDRCLVDGLIQFMRRDATRPFFAMGWTQQTHHPYEPTPGVPMLDLVKEPTPDAYDLERYLNVLHETDRQLERLFDAVRAAGLADDTLIVVVGDHGQAFGVPHDSYLQGRTVYEEDVHVPLLIWFPRRYRTGLQTPAVGGQVDLAPTIAELAGLPPAPDWQGRSLFDPRRSPRAYFYVAQDEFKLGVRENNWKYILDLRAGAEELFDLAVDPAEQHNLAAEQHERCARLRQRLAAWTEANHRQYAVAPPVLVPPPS